MRRGGDRQLGTHGELERGMKWMRGDLVLVERRGSEKSRVGKYHNKQGSASSRLR